VLSKIYGDIDMYRRKTDASQKQATTLKEELLHIKEIMSTVQTERDHFKKILEQKELEDKRFEEAQSKKIKELECLLSKEEGRASEYLNKVKLFDENARRLKDLQNANDEYRTQLGRNEDRMSATINEAKDLTKIVDTLK